MPRSSLYWLMLSLGLNGCSSLLPYKVTNLPAQSANTPTTAATTNTKKALSDDALKQVSIASNTSQIVVDCNTLTQTRVAVSEKQQQVTAQTNPDCAAISRDYINDVSTQIQSPAVINPVQALTPQAAQPNLTGDPYNNIDNAIRQAYQQIILNSPNSGIAPRNP